MTDLLDLLDDLDHDPGADLIHAIRPNMWAACGWCSCGCTGRRHDTYQLRTHRTDGITCQDCLTAMKENPWPT